MQKYKYCVTSYNFNCEEDLEYKIWQYAGEGWRLAGVHITPCVSVEHEYWHALLIFERPEEQPE